MHVEASVVIQGLFSIPYKSYKFHISLIIRKVKSLNLYVSYMTYMVQIITMIIFFCIHSVYRDISSRTPGRNRLCC